MEMVGGCCVCLDERGWDENPLVYCDGHGCNVAVHQACYGIVRVPKGPWFCCKCQSTERVARVKCELCPFKEGALKRTDNGGWAHVVCALYIPEVRFGNVTTMEPILLSSIPHERFLKICYICEENGRESKTSNGACMSCNRQGCKLSFHVTCAQSKRMLCEEAGHFGNVLYVGYCSQHWVKKNKGHALSMSDSKKTTKEKERTHRSRQDSASSSDGSSSKLKSKKQVTNLARVPADASEYKTTHNHSTTTLVNNCNGIKQYPQSMTGNPIKYAAESLNLLQQMPNMVEYFPPDARPKTPLNTVIPPLNSPSQFCLPGVPPQSMFKSSEAAEDLIDVESTPKTSPLNMKVERQSPSSQKSKHREKSSPKTLTPNQAPKKSSSSNSKSNNSNSKSVSIHDKSSSSHSKSNVSNLKSSSNQESKKRKISEAEKASKKQKIEEKKKNSAKKREKHLSIPRPSKLKMYEDEKFSSLLATNKRDQNSDSFRELLESQWDQGAQFLIQKATNFDVGSLLSCLHQLRSENDGLESRLNELSARRDRLVAATSRLSEPFQASVELNRKLPLSAMLPKLNSLPNDSNKNSNEKKKPKLREADDKPSHSIDEKILNNVYKSGSPSQADLHSDTSLDGLGCKEVLSEDNSPKSKPIKKEPKRRDGAGCTDETRSPSFANNLHSLVQPPISMPSNPSHAVEDAGYSQNPSVFIHQMMAQQQANIKRMIASPQPPIPSMMDYLSPQFTNGNTQNEARMNRKLDRNSPAEMSFRPVTSTPSRNSPKENNK